MSEGPAVCPICGCRLVGVDVSPQRSWAEAERVARCLDHGRHPYNDPEWEPYQQEHPIWELRKVLVIPLATLAAVLLVPGHPRWVLASVVPLLVIAGTGLTVRRARKYRAAQARYNRTVDPPHDHWVVRLVLERPAGVTSAVVVVAGLWALAATHDWRVALAGLVITTALCYVALRPGARVHRRWTAIANEPVDLARDDDL